MYGEIWFEQSFKSDLLQALGNQVIRHIRVDLKFNKEVDIVPTLFHPSYCTAWSPYYNLEESILQLSNPLQSCVSYKIVDGNLIPQHHSFYGFIFCASFSILYCRCLHYLCEKMIGNAPRFGRKVIT